MGDFPGRAYEDARSEAVKGIPEGYSPWLHLAVPALVGLTIAGSAVAALHDLQPYQLLTVPVGWVFSNLTEWHAHRYILHRRFPGLRSLCDSHLQTHHRALTGESMALRSAREFHLVLMPLNCLLILGTFYAISTALLVAAGLRNVGLLWAAMSMLYVLVYEWLHLAFHLPTQSWAGRLWLVRALRDHHQVHHLREHMQKGNFNVTLPLSDWLLGTHQRGTQRGAP